MTPRGPKVRIAARQGDTRDEWLVAKWRVWPDGVWEAFEIYARVDTPDGDPARIKLAHAIADLVRGRIEGKYRTADGKLVTVPPSE